MKTISANTLFAPPSRMSLSDLDASMAQFNDRIQSTLGSGGRVEDLPLSPWGGSLSDAGVKGLAGGNSSASTVPNASLTRGNDFGAMFVSKAASAPAQQPSSPPPADNQQPAAPKAPPFPGADGDAGDYVEWATYYSNLKAKFPGLDASFPELKDYARDWLIEQGVEYAKEKFDKLIKNSLTSWLQSDYLDDAMKTANAETGGILDKIQKRIEEEWAKYEGIFSDPAQWLSDKFFKDGLPYLANLGMEKLFGSIWAVDAEKSSALEYMAHMAAKAMVQEIVDTLLAGVKDLDSLIQNFEDLQKNLFKKIDEFFGGAPFKPGTATLPIARIEDKDDKTDFVATGLPTVVALGSPVARITDLMMPSGKMISVGSTTVLVGELYVARQTSATEIPSVITTGAPNVFVGGPASEPIAPGGGLYCPATPNGAPPGAPATPTGLSAMSAANTAVSTATGAAQSAAKANSSAQVGGAKNSSQAGSDSKNQSDSQWFDELKGGESPPEENQCQLSNDSRPYPAAPPNDLVNADGKFTPDEHLDRNKYNYCPQNDPGVGTKDGVDWWTKSPQDCHAPLNCYEGSELDGRLGDGSYECCYRDGKLIENTAQSGTFNFHNSRDNLTGHTVKDYAPHMNYGYGDQYSHVNMTLNAPPPPSKCQPGFGGLIPNLATTGSTSDSKANK